MKCYYRIMLGKKSVYAEECYKGNFIGADFGIDIDLIDKSGAWFSVEGTDDRFHGRQNLYDALSAVENVELKNDLYEKVIANLNGDDVKPSESVDEMPKAPTEEDAQEPEEPEETKENVDVAKASGEVDVEEV